MGEEEHFEGFPRDRFVERRGRVLAALGDGAMVIPAAPLLYRTGDTELRYRPDSELFYLTGFTEPGAVLILRGFADEERSVLLVRPRDEAAERWTGERVGPGAAQALVGVDRAHSVAEVSTVLPELLSGAGRIHYRLWKRRSLDRVVIEALKAARSAGRRDGTGPRAVVDPGEILDDFRLRKDDDEISAMREAAAITAAGIREGLRFVEPDAGEWEVEAAVESTFRRRGAREPAFATIVGSGPNACTLHYVQNSRHMRDGELVLIDAGAEHRMYAGDATRTVPVSGQFSSQQAEVYGVVEEARRRAVQAVSPGAAIELVHRSCLVALVGGLVEIGVLEGEVDDLIEAKEHRPYFPHQTSHWLGLDTHDVGDYRRDGASRTLEPGMVLTIEPGLYFPPQGEGAFHGIGIRIEDDVLVTVEGRDVLTKALPTDATEVSALVGPEARA